MFFIRMWRLIRHLLLQSPSGCYFEEARPSGNPLKHPKPFQIINFVFCGFLVFPEIHRNQADLSDNGTQGRPHGIETHGSPKIQDSMAHRREPMAQQIQTKCVSDHFMVTRRTPLFGWRGIFFRCVRISSLPKVPIKLPRMSHRITEPLPNVAPNC